MRSVLLLHQTSDGSSHYDWMIERPDVDNLSPEAPPAGESSSQKGLLTFRIQQRIDCGQVVEFLAERLPDHRRIYLTYQGEVSGHRGTVTRVAEGDLEFSTPSDATLVLAGTLGRARGTFRGQHTGGAHWKFRFEPA